jgi:plastocyanin
MRLNRHFAALLAIGAAVAVPIVGCGGSSNDNSTTNAATQASTTGGAAATGAGGTVNLTATDFKFNPSDPTVSSGDVTFDMKNDGKVSHSLEIEDVNGQDKELEGTVSPGQSGTLKVNLPAGKYEFYCPVDNHKQMGMEGEITVK